MFFKPGNSIFEEINQNGRRIHAQHTRDILPLIATCQSDFTVCKQHLQSQKQCLFGGTISMLHFLELVC